ncbi:MAG: class I SAM-dependent DNA methyltransferase [Pikeienuella sp.]|uniref:class I SAM-dependent DNA methyltransferase n=1 Tax=Pikeienuella sp. TaxID=2831957 RepID=UPI003918AC60
MSGDEETLAFYDREGAAYADWSAPKGEYAWLEKFLSMAPEGRLLDYGCGGGWAAKRMLDAGRKVEAFDGSAGLAAEASKLTGINVKVMRFEGLDAVARYAGIWASFCLLHAPRAAMEGNLARIARALRPGGLLYLGLKKGEGEARDSLGRFYSYFGREEIGRLLAEAGFRDIDLREKQGGGYDGVPEEVMHIFCRKSDA